MRKEELIKLIESLPCEDKSGEIKAEVFDANGGKFETDSIRLDMDGGRLIVCQMNSPCYDTNKKNWETELSYVKRV